jgi:hypothetical protein
VGERAQGKGKNSVVGIRKSEVGKKISDCGFEKRKKFYDLGIERVEDKR